MSLNRLPTTPTPYSLDARCALPVTRRAGQRRGRRATLCAPANSWRRAPRPSARVQRRSRPADPSAPRPNNIEPARSPTSSAAPSPTGTPTTTIQPTCFSTHTPYAQSAPRQARAASRSRACAARPCTKAHRRCRCAASNVATLASVAASVTSSRSVLHVAPNLRIERAWLHDRQTGIDARDELRHGGQQRFRRLRRAHVERGAVAEIARLAARQHDLRHERRLDVVGKPSRARDRRSRRRAAPRRSNAIRLPIGLAPSPKRLAKLSLTIATRGASSVSASREIAAGQQRDVERREESGTDLVEVDVLSDAAPARSPRRRPSAPRRSAEQRHCRRSRPPSTPGCAASSRSIASNTCAPRSSG